MGCGEVVEDMVAAAHTAEECDLYAEPAISHLFIPLKVMWRQSSICPTKLVPLMSFA